MSGPAGNTVVALFDDARQQKIKRDQDDIRTALGQLEVYRKYFRKWNVLPAEEHRLLGFLVDRSIGFGDETKYITYRLLIEGDKTSHGLGGSKRQLMRVMAQLEARGVIAVDRSQAHLKGLLISVNTAWEPSADMIAIPKRKQRDETHTSSSWVNDDDFAIPGDTDVTTPVSPMTPPPVTPTSPLYSKKSLARPSLARPSSPALAALDRTGSISDEDFLGTREEKTQPSPSRQTLSHPPVAPAPLPETTADSLLADLRRTHGQLAKKPARLNPGAIEDTFRAAFEDAYRDHPGAVFVKWGEREMGMVKQAVIKTWTGKPEELHAFVAWSVTNWTTVIRDRFRSMKSPPMLPDVGFFTRFRSNFVQAHSKDLTRVWVAGLADHEAKEFHRLTLEKGLTDEEARMEIAENRAMSRMRKQNEDALREANLKLSQAALAEQNAARRSRVASTIHPESETAKRLAREKAAAERAAREIVPIDPDWVAPDFSNIPAWNPA